MYLPRRFLSIILTLILALGLSAQAAGTAPDPNPTREDLTLDEILTRYDDHTHVAYADTHQWPASGTVCIEIAGVFTLSDLNGMILPANLIIDVYQRYGGDKFRFVVRYDTTDVKSITVTDAEADAEAGDKVAGFDDVSYSDYFAEAVEWAVEEGVTQGTGNGAFSPKSTVTRAEAVTFLWRAAGSPAPKTSASAFSDVTDQNDYYYSAVLWAVEQDITQGVGGGRFNLTGTLAYDQIFTFLCRFAGEEADGADWSAAAVTWAKTSGLTDGLSFTAKAACPRSDVVYCLYKQLGDGEGTAEQPQEEQDPSDPEQPILSNEVGATLAITTGFLDKKSAIDISDFGLEASQAEQLALEIADIDGANPYGVTSLNAYEQDGQIAKTLAVYYTTSTISITTVADSDWRYISDAALAEADRVVDTLITSSMSDYDVVKTLHDYLVTHCDYDYRVDIGNMPFISHQAEGALLEGTAVCSGYAKAYEALLDAAGIPCETITGYAGGYHAWNLVQVDGQWYHVDATNLGGDYIRYTYFLKSDKVMVNRSHRNWEAIYACTSTKYDEDLLDSRDQAQADDRQEQVDAILAACAPALANVPTWTQAELQALSDQELSDALYFTIDMSGSGFDSNTLSKYSREVTDAIIAQHPEFAYGSFRSQRMCFEFRRDDVAAEQQRRQAIKQEEQQKEEEAQQAEEEARREANIQEIQAYLENLLQTGEFEEQYITLPGYEVSELRAACQEMTTDGYQFGDYLYNSSAEYPDYEFTVLADGRIRVKNIKWAEDEIGYFIALIEDGIRRGETVITVPYREYENEVNDIYATRAANRMKENYSFDGYTAGVDYVIEAQGGSPDVGTHTIRVSYPNQTQSEDVQEEQTQDQDTGMEEQTSEADTGTGEQTSEADTGTGEQTSEADTGMGEQTSEADTGTGEQTSEADTGTGEQG